MVDAERMQIPVGCHITQPNAESVLHAMHRLVDLVASCQKVLVWKAHSLGKRTIFSQVLWAGITLFFLASHLACLSTFLIAANLMNYLLVPGMVGMSFEP